MEEITLNDILRFFWRRKTIIIGLPLIMTVFTFFFFMFKTPTYTSSMKIAMGGIFKEEPLSTSSKDVLRNEVYNDPLSAIQLITSNDVLTDVQKKTNFSIEKSIEVKPIDKTRIIQINVKNLNPTIAQQINRELGKAYLEKNDSFLKDKRAPLEQLLLTLQKQYDHADKNLIRNEAALKEIETNETLQGINKGSTRVRLLGYIAQEQDSIIKVTSQIKELTLRLSDMQKAAIVEEATLPIRPDSKGTMKYLLLTLFSGLFCSFILALFLEYLENNPIRIQGHSNNISKVKRKGND